VRVGIVGTGAIARLHARVYRNIGFSVRAVVDVNPAAAAAFTAEFGGEVVADIEAVCAHPDVEYVDVCTLPNVRLEVVELCAKYRKHVQVQKPIATTVEIARRMLDVAESAGIVLGVVSQHRFDESSQFLEGAIRGGRLGRILQCDAYVKWHRSDEYYARPIKGTWAVEGGGALVNQAIHQVDLMRWLMGPVRDVWGTWQLGAAHSIESEDVLSAMLRFESGATGVIQASTAFWPGYPERVEIHGTKGTAIVTGDRLTTWDVLDDRGGTPPVSHQASSGASDPLAISLEPFERQFLDFADAIRSGRAPAVSGRDGLLALEVVDAIYRACRSGERQPMAGERP
jgi:UDP-N-acetyl-2-amino-2-deoxyglucuronate dehydrogenase